jgi:glutathione-independent formaldehyde dehydrogenase
MYEGRTAAKPGIIFGHENLGIVEEISSGVTDIKVGDRVVMPFNIGYGHCRNCEEQTEYLCVPYADFNVLKLPNTDNLHEKDFVLFTDIFPTGWDGVT